MQSRILRDRVTIEEQKNVPNGQGGFKSAWLTAPGAESVPAEIVGLSGDEALRLGVERSTTTFRVRMRRRPSLAVTPEHRLKWKSAGGEIMAIRSVLPDPRDPRAALLLIAEIGNGS
jgi:head-tail adaptor